MERHQLEDQIRASLQTRADDVEATPELWERVSDRTTRRSRWLVGLWALSGAAAVVAVVFGGMALFGNPRNIEIQPGPEVVDTPETVPTPTPEATTDATPVPTTSDPTVVTTDGQVLYEIDPASGEVIREMDPFEGIQAAGIREVAVRPTAEEGRLTVATVIEIEGMYDVEVSVFEDGQRVDRERIGMAGPDAGELPPDVVWSQDGRYLMWAGTSFIDGETSGPALWAYDWAERPLNSDGIAEPFTATAPGADGALFEGGGTVDLREWTGASEGQSRLVATTATGGAYFIELAHSPSDCGGTEWCPPTWETQISDLVFEGSSPIDLGTLDSGVNLALVAPAGQGGPDGDAEGATLSLVAEPMSDVQTTLDVPELTAGTAAPGDGWLAVAGNRVAVGFGGQSAYLLTVTGDVVEELEVAETIELPAGTRAVGMAQAGQPAPPPDGEVEPSTPTEGPSEATAPAIGEDGVPLHVITGGRDQLQLVNRNAPDQPVLTIERPDGIDAETAAGEVLVHPDSTPDDLQLVTTWATGEANVLARTVVRDGEVVANEVLDEQVQPDNAGGQSEAAYSAPVFSPDGRWLAWVETPDGGDGPAQVRIVDWADGEVSGPGREIVAPGSAPRPFQLLDWARTPEGDVLTMAPATGPGPEARETATMIELRLQVTSSLIAETTDDDWRFVDLPGALFEAGSYTFEDGAQRYIAFDGGDQVLYSLAEAPDTAVETGAYAFSEGRIVAFGPDSALVQRADGGWQRVQVDTGAASPVEMPDATRAVLPWHD